MNVCVRPWRDALATMRDTWDQLVRESGANPSLHPDWLDKSITAWGMENTIHVAAAERNGTLIAVMPFFVTRRSLSGVPVRCLELASNVISYHAEIVCRGDLNDALTALLSHKALPSWDVLLLNNIVAGGPTATAVRDQPKGIMSGYSTRPGENSPFVQVNCGWSEYLATRPKKVRANILRSRRLMLDAGETGIAWYEDGADTDRLLNEIFEVEAKSWKADAGIDIRPGTAQGKYYEALLPWLAENGGLFGNMLYVADRPVAYVLCAAWQGWYGQLKTSYVKALPDAGSRVIQTSLERAFERGATEYDFLGDAAPHKLRWSSSLRPHEDVWLFASHLRGSALRQLKRVADYLHEHRKAAANGTEPASATD
jgi:CelD/BcsL family acetyltransferase involved in cellulose biosynthesis